MWPFFNTHSRYHGDPVPSLNVVISDDDDDDDDGVRGRVDGYMHGRHLFLMMGRRFFKT
jgi:hypothetical protein